MLKLALLLVFSSTALALGDLSAIETLQTVASKAQLYTALEQMMSSTQTATFKLTSYQKMGEHEEFTAGRVTWAGQDSLRIDVDQGRGKGSTAVLRNGGVIAWQRGWLRFVKLNFKLRNKRVVSVRGRDLSDTGFFDDLRFVLDHWDCARVSPDEAGFVIEYQNDQRLPTRLWLSGEPLQVSRHEVHDAGVMVGRYTYQELLLNPKIDLGLLDP